MSQFYNNVKTFLLLALLTALVLWVGSLIGGSRGVGWALVLAAIGNFSVYFFCDRIALMSMQAVEVGPEHELFGIVEQLAHRANLPMPRVFVSPAAAPNAFATGRNPYNACVCATQGLLQLLDRREIAGVMGHELGHVLHHDILIQSVATTIAGAISYFPYFLWYGGGRDSEGRSNPLAIIAVLILAPIGALLIQAAISRSREFNADKQGAELCGDPMALATALEKIDAAARRIPLNVNPAFNSMFIAEPTNVMQTVANLFATHPTLEQRLIHLIGREHTGLVGAY